MHAGQTISRLYLLAAARQLPPWPLQVQTLRNRLLQICPRHYNSCLKVTLIAQRPLLPLRLLSLAAARRRRVPISTRQSSLALRSEVSSALVLPACSSSAASTRGSRRRRTREIGWTMMRNPPTEINLPAVLIRSLGTREAATRGRHRTTTARNRESKPLPQCLTRRPPMIIVKLLPQATVDEYSPSDSKRNSLRHSQQSANFQQQQQDGKLQPSNINIPLMFFTPATPQMNVSPISPARSSGGQDIFDRYAEMKTSDSGVGIAQSTPDPYPTKTKATYENPSSSQPSPPPAYTFQPLNVQKNLNASTALYQNSTNGNFPRPPPAAASDSSSAVPRTVPPTAGIFITGKNVFVPRPSTASDPGPPPHDRAPTPPEAAYSSSAYPSSGTDMSAIPSTISRANSHQWRMSVERAADKAMDRVRHSVGSRCDDVPEEEERLTRNSENDEEMSRGRSKWRRSGASGVSPSGRASLQRPAGRRATTGSVSSVDGSRSRSRTGRSSISLTRVMERSASRRASGNVMMV